MAIKRLNKNDILRGRIMDEIAAHFGTSVLGLYDKKLRIEMISEEGEVYQFSIAPTVHKELVDEAECDPYLTTDEKIKSYEETLQNKGNKKNEDKKSTKKETKEETKNTKLKKEEVLNETQEDANDEMSDEELRKIEELMKQIG